MIATSSDLPNSRFNDIVSPRFGHRQKADTSGEEGLGGLALPSGGQSTPLCFPKMTFSLLCLP